MSAKNTKGARKLDLLTQAKDIQLEKFKTRSAQLKIDFGKVYVEK
jgi:hypothetical protein